MSADPPGQPAGHHEPTGPAQPQEPAGPLAVTVVRDHEDLPSTQHYLRQVADPDRGVLVIRHVPYDRVAADFPLAVLESLDKILPARPVSRLWEQTLAWTAGYRLDHIVLDRAHTLPSHLTEYLRALTDARAIMTGDPRLRLWLIDAARTKASSVIDRLTGRLTSGRPEGALQVTVAGPDALRLLRPRPAPSFGASASVRGSGPAVPDDLPADSFMTFRAACAQRLDSATFAHVDVLWGSEFSHARRWVTHHRSIAEAHHAPVALALPLSVHLAARFAATTPGEALLRLRATRAGLLREGLLLHHHSWPAGGGLHHRLTPTAAAAVNRGLSPAAAAAAILYLLFPYDRRDAEKYWHPDALTLADLAPDARYVQIADTWLPVPPYARPALLAQAALRQHLSNIPPDQQTFFSAVKPRRDPRRLAEHALAQTTASAHLYQVNPAAPPGHGTAWMRQRRLTLRNLVGSLHTLDLSTPAWT